MGYIHGGTTAHVLLVTESALTTVLDPGSIASSLLPCPMTAGGIIMGIGSTASVGRNAHLSWIAVTGATGYEVDRRGEQNGPTWKKDGWNNVRRVLGRPLRRLVRGVVRVSRPRDLLFQRPEPFEPWEAFVPSDPAGYTADPDAEFFAFRSCRDPVGPNGTGYRFGADSDGFLNEDEVLITLGSVDS